MPNLPPIRIYWHAPAPLFAARVNMPDSITYPIQEITYDGVTTGVYTDLAADMLFTLGSAAGLDDCGRGRLRAAPTSTILKVGRSSQGFEDGQLEVVDNAYITVYAEFRVHAKIPRITTTAEYKDADLAVGTLTQQPPPVATMGPDRARRIDASTEVVRFYFDSAGSYAVADGATIVSVAWDIDDGSYVLGTSATDAAIYADFPAGVRYVSLTVTDSNGKTHTTRRLVLADDPDDSLCVSGMQVTSLSRTIDGSVARLRVLQDLPRAEYPDGAHILIFEDRDIAPAPESWDDLLFSGWHNVDEASATATETHLRRETELTCVDVAGRLDSLPGFNQRIEKPDDDGVWTWGEMDAPNMDKFLVYLLHWHSTALAVADFFPSGTWDDYPFVLFDAVGDTLFNQLSRQANRLVPDHEFTSDRWGRLRVTVNPQLQDPADRTSTVHNSVTEQGWSAIEFGYTRPPRVHTLRGSAVLTGTGFELDGDGEEIIPTAFCIAPGTAPGQGGRESIIGERLAQSQAALNRVVGHHYARMNARYGPINVTLNSNSDPWDFDPAALTWVQLITSASTAPQRGLDFTSIRCLCREVSIDYSYAEEGTTYRARVVLEPETVGLPALTEEQNAALPVGEQPLPTVPPDFGLLPSAELVAAIDEDGTLYRTSDFQTASGDGGPTWTQHSLGITDDKVYSFVVDPFSPGYINGDGTGTIDGWVVTESDIYRVADMFGTPSATSIHTFATAIDHTDPRQTRTIQASFGAYFAAGINPWLLVISHYADETGHEGTWALRSLNGGATWLGETQVSQYYDTSTSADNPPVEIGVYTSPKTPGLAYTSAYATTGNPALAAGYQSVDWGATWTPIEAIDDPDQPLPRWYSSEDAVFTDLGVSNQQTLITTSVSDGPMVSRSVNLLIYPPKDAVRVEVDVYWSAAHTRTGGLASGTSDLDCLEPTGVTQTGNDNYSNPSPNTSTAGVFSSSYALVSGADWPGNREAVEVTPPTTTNAVRWLQQVLADASGEGNVVTMTMRMTVVVTEIELDGGIIYNPGAGALFDPGHRPSGALHVPWLSNDSELVVYSGKTIRGAAINYGTNRAEGDGTTITDISPTESAIDYGPQRSGFGIRAYDSDRAYLAMGAAANDTTADTDDDAHGVFVSDDGGDTWTMVLGPTAQSSFTGKRGYSAAFSGTDEEVLYIFGAPSGVAGCISFTSNFGSSIDSREGNLGSFGISSLLGIAGGPTGGS